MGAKEAVLNDMGEIGLVGSRNVVGLMAGDTGFYPFPFVPCFFYLDFMCPVTVGAGDRGCAVCAWMTGEVGQLVAAFAGE